MRRTKRDRKCCVCGVDISNRGRKAKYCIECAKNVNLQNSCKRRKYNTYTTEGCRYLTEDEAYINLAAVILRHTMRNYENALARLKKHPGSTDAANTVAALKKDICSKYYSILSCGIDLKAAAGRLEKKYFG